MTIADSITKHTDHPKAGQATDPVCGMSVDPATARHRAEYAGDEAEESVRPAKESP